MHPMERLRYVARSSGVDDGMLVREAAGALASVADDPHAIVIACRQMVERQPASGPLLWLAARVMSAADARHELREAVREVSNDEVAGVLIDELPAGAAICVVGRPDGLDEARIARVDLDVVEVELDDEPLGSWFDDEEDRRSSVPLREAAAAVGEADLVLAAADAIGPDRLLAPMGTFGVVAAANVQGTPVWVPVAPGRLLPRGLLRGMRQRIDDLGDDLGCADEVVPLRLIDELVDGRSRFPTEGVERRTTCPDLASLGARGAAG